MSRTKSRVMELNDRLSEAQVAERTARIRMREIGSRILRLKELHHLDIDDPEMLTEIDDRLAISLERVDELEQLYKIGKEISSRFETEKLG